MIATVTYSTWIDKRTGSWEVVRWEGGKALVVQRNIPTKAKAIAARNIWRERQRMSDANCIPDAPNKDENPLLSAGGSRPS
jgi:hypothetical protein